jgi:phytoene synthase
VVIPAGLRESYAYCALIARRHYENFPVASRLLPAAMRPHVAAIYAFARIADDYADEGRLEPDDRLRRLDDWRRRLWACAAGDTAQDGEHRPVFAALAHTLATCHLPVQLFDDLLSAFVQDVTTHRYRDWSQLLDYCRRSANPVGRLLLRVAGYRENEALDRSSDALCTALQLTNFWQDLARDWATGRLYLPEAEAARLGARIEDFNPSALSLEWRSTIEYAVNRTRDLFRDGRDVCDAVHGRLRYELRLTWLGGTRVLERLATNGYNAHTSRPRLAPWDFPGLMWKAITWTV